MKHYFFLCTIAITTHFLHAATEKEIVVIIPSYNNAKYYKKNLRSVLDQKYNNFQAIYIDDCSPDGTGKLVEDYLTQHEQQNRFALIKNSQRLGALANIYNAIYTCNNDAIIITLDGDDWFAHDQVLARINKEYCTCDVWLTYGQYKRYPRNKLGYSKQLPQEVIINNAYREYEWSTSHLRTFYAWLFKCIQPEDLMHKGKFFTMTWDKAFMLPMLEMAGQRSKFINDVLYVYNMENVINDFKVDKRQQEYLEKIILSKPKYPVLANRPF